MRWRRRRVLFCLLSTRAGLWMLPQLLRERHGDTCGRYAKAGRRRGPCWPTGSHAAPPSVCAAVWARRARALAPDQPSLALQPACGSRGAPLGILAARPPLAHRCLASRTVPGGVRDARTRAAGVAPHRSHHFFASFLFFIPSILYQRGVYPPEAFEQRRQYGLAVMVTSDARLGSYLATVLEALEGWLETGTLQKLVLVIAGTPEGDVLERWTFDVQADKAIVGGDAPLPAKDEADIMAEIGAVIRQITASVTFLPMLNRPCEFIFVVGGKRGGEMGRRRMGGLPLPGRGVRGFAGRACRGEKKARGPPCPPCALARYVGCVCRAPGCAHVVPSHPPLFPLSNHARSRLF